MIQTTVFIPEGLIGRANTLALQLHISKDQLFSLALEQFISNTPDLALPGVMDPAQEKEPAILPDQPPVPSLPRGEAGRIIRKGDIYWVPVEAPGSNEAGILHPHVVIQEDIINRSRVSTVVVCALTSNLKRAKAPGNILLQAGEGNLPRQSVVEVSKVSAAAKTQFGEYIGSLSIERVQQILTGMQFLQLMMDHPAT